MEWWGYATSGLGAALGLFGAIRGWRADRRTQALSQPWTLDHFQNDAWLLTSRLPTDAHGVRVALEGHMSIVETDGDLNRVVPSGFVKFIIFKPGTSGGTGMQVTWRQGVFRCERTARIAMQPKPAASK
ncbi:MULTISPECIES: hypothetical protein [unclassified Frondihabitans]|uniref:hypothetical protein n=1 Tax=unclassified Frondihabitans TaxID=2626248 RepID=UPI000F50A96D|nr:MULTISPECIES: hypothetical protein [unclassified Frondihabitans]RPE75192.1 hypothetical protein EDF37_2796 [Frondihabitans sp. PhB153]RPF04434.1 hypothetical protein EDF39_2864 [Frondihabitans sp. PhB161]